MHLIIVRFTTFDQCAYTFMVWLYSTKHIEFKNDGTNLEISAVMKQKLAL